MNSYRCVDQIFTHIDLSQESDPHRIAIHQEIICGGDPILDENIPCDLAIGKSLRS